MVTRGRSIFRTRAFRRSSYVEQLSQSLSCRFNRLGIENSAGTIFYIESTLDVFTGPVAVEEMVAVVEAMVEEMVEEMVAVMAAVMAAVVAMVEVMVEVVAAAEVRSLEFGLTGPVPSEVASQKQMLRCLKREKAPTYCGSLEE